MLNPIYYTKAILVCMVGCNATLRCFGSLFFYIGKFYSTLCIYHRFASTAARVDPILVAKSTRPTPYVDLMRILA